MNFFRPKNLISISVRTQIRTEKIRFYVISAFHIRKKKTDLSHIFCTICVCSLKVDLPAFTSQDNSGQMCDCTEKNNVHQQYNTIFTKFVFNKNE